MNTARPARNVNLPFILVIILAGSVLVSSFAANVFAATASLSWAAPTTYTDGTPITNLGGYRVYTGTTSGSYSQNIDVGNVTSYTVSGLNNAATYYFAVTAYDASGDVSGFSSQASYTTPAAPPSSNTYTLSASAGSDGSISPSGSTVVSQGTSQTYAITPNTNYYIVSVSVDGAVVASNVMTYSYTFSDVTANHAISATFAYCTKLITASAGNGGTISPASVYVDIGSSQTFAITPSTGYNIAGVTVDGASVGAVSSYTFNNVTIPHTISTTFSANSSYSISASAGANGNISPSGTVSVAGGKNQSFTITPTTNYYIVSVSIDGAVAASNVMTYSYTFSNVTANHTISATFAHCTELITVGAAANGSISPGSTYVNIGSSQTFSITPNSGHKILAVTVDGASVGAISRYTFNNVTKTHSINATFK
ncbi:MAG: fibronectin type III domain-containing protein [Oryzomonas sp.]|uniref:fibronectin type III domain-containing protein n=1 Tax=Oryzomonas sp. TaxID=2855186 RepID=UPI002846B07D|nr:fibronectin type III domain-containing protein [Oryzomonas sp.]MDR3579650.1 fibronectin type III domain-containing protein [Oryzomonas sp.]